MAVLRWLFYTPKGIIGEYSRSRESRRDETICIKATSSQTLATMLSDCPVDSYISGITASKPRSTGDPKYVEDWALKTTLVPPFHHQLLE